MDNRRAPRETWSAALTLVFSGLSASESAKRCGVHTATVVRWLRLAGMETLAGGKGGIPVVDFADPLAFPGRRYRRLTFADRVFIEAALYAELAWSMRRIAQHLGVNVSTISREVGPINCSAALPLRTGSRTTSMYIKPRWPMPRP